MLMPIGRFAWCTGLSVKALRHYDELGLLPPARVDRETGYRWYSPEQVEIAIRVRRLRELDLPLAEIRGIRDGADERAILSAHRERVEARRARDTRILAELARIVGGVERILPDDWLYRIEVKDIAPQDVAVIAGRVPAAELDRWVKDSIGELLEQLGEQGIGPPFAIRPAPDDQEMVEVEVGL